jgi:hypothetical protein
MTDAERRLRETVQHATGGQWAWRLHPDDEPDSACPSFALVAADGAIIHTDGSARGEYGPDIDVSGPDAAHIAAACPDNVKVLLAELDALRRQLAAARAELERRAAS